MTLEDVKWFRAAVLTHGRAVAAGMLDARRQQEAVEAYLREVRDGAPRSHCFEVLHGLQPGVHRTPYKKPPF